ncbi:hypothetical protein GINT2_000499 [Glugoides intestinalis]
MDNDEALKKLIPMSDDEITSLLGNDLKISPPTLLDASKSPKSPVKTTYGDFSMNSFVIVDTPEYSDREDNCNVYMESVIDLFKTLNTKVEALKTERSVEKEALNKINAYLRMNDMKSALNTIKDISKEEDLESSVLYRAMIEKTIPNFLLTLRQTIMGIKEHTFQLMNLYKDIETKLYKKAEENERLKTIINQQSKEHKEQIESLVTENNDIKDEIYKLCKEYGTEDKLESLLEVDILKELKQLISRKTEMIDDLREEVIIKEEVINKFERKAGMLDVVQLNTQVDSLKQTQRKLQDENLNLTQIANKMSEKNTKLKHELLFFNSELKKAMEAVARKNDTIGRQKVLIELFQEKLSGPSGFPIEDLKKKKVEIEEKLMRETDYFTKQKLNKEKDDCIKRLSDFLNLEGNKKV